MDQGTPALCGNPFSHGFSTEPILRHLDVNIHKDGIRGQGEFSPLGRKSPSPV